MFSFNLVVAMSFVLHTDENIERGCMRSSDMMFRKSEEMRKINVDIIKDNPSAYCHKEQRHNESQT